MQGCSRTRPLLAQQRGEAVADARLGAGRHGVGAQVDAKERLLQRLVRDDARLVWVFLCVCT